MSPSHKHVDVCLCIVSFCSNEAFLQNLFLHVCSSWMCVHSLVGMLLGLDEVARCLISQTIQILVGNLIGNASIGIITLFHTLQFPLYIFQFYRKWVRLYE